MVKKHGKDFYALFDEAKWSEHFSTEWTEIYYLFKKMPVTDDYSLEWKNVDQDEVIKQLCDEHDFSKERIETTLKKFGRKEQKGLGEFF